MLCAMWCHVYNLKNVKNTHRGELLIVKLQSSAISDNFLKSKIVDTVFPATFAIIFVVT